VIVDAHNDLLLELAFRRREERPFERYWLENLTRGRVGLQVCPLFVDLVDLPEAGLRRALEAAAAFHRAARENAERVLLVRTRADLDEAAREGRLGLMLSMEGAEPLGYDPDLVEAFWELGVRMVGLTWNRRNAFADGAAEPAAGGLSRLGERLVDRLVALGMLIDLAHASVQTFADVLDRSGDAPVLVSHAGCRALVDTPRNVADDQLRALADRDGVFCVMALPLVVDPENPTIDRVVDHVDHAVETIGIEHVGLGGDFIRQVARATATAAPADALLPPGMTFDAAIEDLAGPEEYPNLLAALERRGYEGESLDALLRGNLLRLFARALPD
jgi:membrane dipeptidase